MNIKTEQTIKLWKYIFGYKDQRNNPEIVIEKKIEIDDLIYVALQNNSVIGTVMAGYDRPPWMDIFINCI